MIKHILGITALVLTLTACNTRNPKEGTPRMESNRIGIVVKSVRGGTSYSELGVWTDPSTGCEYYTGEVDAGIFMTPKIGADQLPVCDKSKSSDFDTYNRLKKQFGE
jgi:uncharacterized lipoprotein NlpE involved in copper resistance